MSASTSVRSRRAARADKTPTRPLRSRLLAFAAVLALVVGGLAAVDTATAPAASALSGSSFNPGYIISDATFFNSSSMSAGDVQSFLNSKVSSCAASNGQPCLKNFSQATATRAATKYCATYQGSGNETAAQIIAKVATACSINPQVILVMLEKEQGLVSSSSPTASMYRSALGYGCPDTAACDSTYYGFFNQVYSAAAQFQSYTKNSSSWSYQPGRVNNILYNPNASCGSSPVYIQNQATANLYIYTPYQPNAAALANLYGTGDGCSAYGNRNFWVFFNTWFGDPTGGGLQSPSFEGGASGWGAGNGFVNQVAYNNASAAQNGSWFFASNTTVPGRSIAQTVTTSVSVGQQVTASIWLRSAYGEPFSGSVALWGLDGQLEAASTAFTVGGSWQQVTVKLPVRASAHSQVKLEVYMDTVAPSTLFIDNAALTYGQAPPLKNLLSSPGFENSQGNWIPGNGFVNRAFYQDAGAAHSGSWFGATNTDVPGHSLAQLVAASPPVGGRYSFSIWVKSAVAGSKFSGTLSLWGLGDGVAYANGTNFTATNKWSQVIVTTDISQPITTLKPEIYLNSTANTLYLDDGVLAANLLTAGSFEGGAFDNWGPGNGTINTAVYSTAATGIASQNGGWFGATNTQTPGSSLAQSVSRETIVGDSYTAQVWLRSSDPSKKFSGTLAIWALGGTTEVATTAFSVGGTWTPVSVVLPLTKADHTSLKFEIYENSTGSTLFVDGAVLF
ncbi:carbohydrate binding domain-containing protein [Subtercola sp. YIM 133946]|uniref:carbohydrate binding domain-containing protein n=1 Tax=Subtercola sp. YIM 133946 TaxID=3118909 RepID=UPI002F944EDE